MNPYGRPGPELPTPYRERPRFLPVKNADSEACPPFGLIKVTGTDLTNGYLTGTRPDTDDETDLLVNGPTPIPAGQAGSAVAGFPASAAYSQANDAGAAPAVGEVWGAKAGSWLLYRGRTGFRILGAGLNGVCVVAPALSRRLEVVKVTSTTPTNGRYPGKLQYYDPETQTWTDGPDVWLVDPNA